MVDEVLSFQAMVRYLIANGIVIDNYRLDYIVKLYMQVVNMKLASRKR